MTPQKAIRIFCRECVGSPGEVKHCGGDYMLDKQEKETNMCWFYPYRTGRGNGKPSLKIIRKNCLECMGSSYRLVRECKNINCPVHSFRFGKRLISEKKKKHDIKIRK